MVVDSEFKINKKPPTSPELACELMKKQAADAIAAGPQPERQSSRLHCLRLLLHNVSTAPAAKPSTARVPTAKPLPASTAKAAPAPTAKATARLHLTC